MTQNKKIIGITGGSGAGKSYISDELRKRGYEVIDADRVGHESINRPECVKELAREFGNGVVSEGKIDRKRLGEAVFGAPERLAALNEITHKYILSDIAEKIRAAKGELVFVDGAVLIESGMKCDAMIGVTAARDVRTARIMRRDGITCAEAERRISAQQEDDFYRKNCDFIIENNGGEINISECLSKLRQVIS